MGAKIPFGILFAIAYFGQMRFFADQTFYKNNLTFRPSFEILSLLRGTGSLHHSPMRPIARREKKVEKTLDK